MPQFIIQGGIPLQGSLHIHGSKNASLPILAATLLTDESCVLHNVPDISDVHAFIDILKGVGGEVSFEQGTVHVRTEKIKNTTASPELVKHMRASILLMGPLLARHGEIELAFPGGCVLGKRSIHAHTHAFTKLGA
jgi:UDP-N-acetylglucosamine 1-carboxyvinyltransferase